MAAGDIAGNSMRGCLAGWLAGFSMYSKSTLGAVGRADSAEGECVTLIAR
jgi:hypothetical protein